MKKFTREKGFSVVRETKLPKRYQFPYMKKKFAPILNNLE